MSLCLSIALTYQASVCAQDDTLHFVSRWAGSGSYTFHLAYLRKKPGQDWEPHRILVSPDRGTYRNNPCMLISDDGGDTWRLAITKDFAAGITPGNTKKS